MPKVLIRAVRSFLRKCASHFGLTLETSESVAVAFVGAFQTRAFLRQLGVQSSDSQRQYAAQVASVFAKGLREAERR
jgi:hypothetical protein